MTYPMWSYFPRNGRPPAWASSFVEVVKSAEGKISTIEHKTGLVSDAVLSNLSPGLVPLSYAVESGKTKQAKIHRPVLFGENGTPSVNYEIDAFHDELGIAVEVEAGRGAAGNADYRDIVRTSLILDARYGRLQTHDQPPPQPCADSHLAMAIIPGPSCHICLMRSRK